MSEVFSPLSLTPSQRLAVEHKDGAMLVIAGPGSGKTRVITSRILRLIEKGVRSYNICAITFTNKAAEEMKERVSEAQTGRGAHISTFHSLCVRILRQYAEAADMRPNFSIYSDAEQKKCIKDAITALDVSTENFQPAKVLAVISNLKNDLVTADEFRSRADDFYYKMLAKIYRRYQKMLQENNAVDFDDLLVKTAFLIRDNEDIRLALSERFKYLLVDEYQDTNHAQYQIAKGIALAHGNICVTGDPDQSIYRWRGADIKNILAFEKDWANATVVKLEENFRSSPKILELADKLIAHNKQRKEKRLVPTIKSSRDVVCNVYQDNVKEAEGVVDQIASLIENGTEPNEIAVLYRTNSMSRSLEEAFRHKGVKYTIVRGIEFYNRKEIRDMIAYLKLICNSQDNLALERIINTPVRGIGNTSIKRLTEFASQHGISAFDAAKQAHSIESLTAHAKTRISQFAEMIEGFKSQSQEQGCSVKQLLVDVYTKSGMQTALQLQKNQDESKENNPADNVEELINSAAKYEETAEEPSLFDYLQTISLFSDSDTYDPNIKKVPLMTLHAAKGLEFENAFIVGLEDGLLPHERSNNNDKELEEERRLFFVGITRAKSGLYISRALSRITHGRESRAMPSKFLYETGLVSGFDDTDLSAHNNGYSNFALGGAGADRFYGERYKSKRRITPKPRQEFPSKIVGKYSQLSSTDKKASSASFEKGDIVEHPEHGRGIIKEYLNLGGANSVITIGFEKAGTKTMMQKSSKLVKVQM